MTAIPAQSFSEVTRPFNRPPRALGIFMKTKSFLRELTAARFIAWRMRARAAARITGHSPMRLLAETECMSCLRAIWRIRTAAPPACLFQTSAWTFTWSKFDREEFPGRSPTEVSELPEVWTSRQQSRCSVLRGAGRDTVPLEGNRCGGTRANAGPQCHSNRQCFAPTSRKFLDTHRGAAGCGTTKA